MKISDQIALSAKNLSRRKGRTALTVIGVVVGTCAVIVMISLGIAQNKANEEMLQSWGDLTQIEIYGGGYTSVAADGSQTTVQPAALNDETVQAIKAMDHVVAATPYAYAYNLNGMLYAGRNNRYQSWLGSNVIGVYADALEPMGFTLSDGEWLTDTMNVGRDKIPVLVGQSAGYNFEDSKKSWDSPKRYRYEGQTDAAGNPLPAFVDVYKDKITLTISTYDENPKEQSWELVVVGTIEPDPNKGWWTQSGIIMRVQDMKMIEQAYKKMTKDTNNQESTYDEVYVKVDDVNNVETVEDILENEMGFKDRTWSMSDVRESMQEQVGRSQLMLGGLAAVSLLVAALNIANTMTMAIYERTREIGVMKVLGCELANIRTMFLIESGCIGFIGGVVGALLSIGLSVVLNNITTIMGFFGQSIDLSFLTGSYYYGAGSTVISSIPPWLVVAALAFATLIGLVSGIAPANRAVKISALEAIRHE